MALAAGGQGAVARAACTFIVAVMLVVSSGCSLEGGDGPAVERLATKWAVRRMFDGIYDSGKPQGFDQLDVSAQVATLFPLGADKRSVERTFKGISSAEVFVESPQDVVVITKRGMAMFDVDPRKIVIHFRFDEVGKLVALEAFHLRNQ